MTYLHRIQRTYYCRIVIPKDLLQYFPNKIIKRSLRTTNKTEARLLLHAEVYAIQQIFYQLRLGDSYMPLPKPSQRTFDTYFKRYGKKASVHEIAQAGEPCIIGTSWKYKDELWKIEEKLALGYDEEEDGFFHLVDAPDFGAQQPLPPEVLQPVIAPTATVTPQKNVISIAVAKELYLTECRTPTNPRVNAPRTAGTMASEEIAVRQFIDFLGSEQTPLNALPKDLTAFTDYLVDTLGQRHSTVNTRLNRLTSFLKYLKKRGYIDVMPTVERLLPREVGKEDEESNISYTNAQLNIIFAYFMNNVPRNLKTRKVHLDTAYLILGLIHTGFRITERIMCKAEAYTADKIPVLVNPKMKNKNKVCIRYVPVHARLLQLGFLEHFKKHPLQDATTLRRYFNDILVKTKIKTRNNEYTVHSCRATFDTVLNGRTEDGIRKRLMGHALTGMDKRYVDQTPDAVKLYQTAVNSVVYELDYQALKAFLQSETAYLYC